MHSIITLFDEEKLQHSVVYKTENRLKKYPKNIQAKVKAKCKVV